MADACVGCGATTNWRTAVDGELVAACKVCLDEGRTIMREAGEARDRKLAEDLRESVRRATEVGPSET